MKIKGQIVKEAKSGETSRLNSQIRKLQRENKQLKSELKTLERALQENIKVLKGSTEDLTVEDLIEAAKKKETIKEVKDKKEKCPNCESEVRPIITRFGRVISCVDCGFKSKEMK